MRQATHETQASIQKSVTKGEFVMESPTSKNCKNGYLKRFTALLATALTTLCVVVFNTPNAALAQFEAFDNCTESNSAGAAFIGKRRGSPGKIGNRIIPSNVWKFYYTLTRRTGGGRSLIVWTQPASCLKMGKRVKRWTLGKWCPNGVGCEKYNDINKW
jgi:hypothetical protein